MRQLLTSFRTAPVLGAIVALVLLSACNPAPPTGSAGGGLVTTTDQTTTWQARWEQTLAAAKKEGKVVVVTHTNLYYRDQVQKFNEKYPDIQVEHVAIRPSEFSPKLITEQQNGINGYDLWISPTSNMVEIVLPTGGFDNMTPYLILPEVTEGTNYRSGAPLWASAEPYILLNRGNVAGGVWVNRDVVSKTDFNHMDQLLDPKFRGRIVFRTPNAPQGSSLTMTGILHVKGEEFVTNLMTQQQPVYIENARLLTQNLIQGRYPIAIGTDNETLDNCQREGGCKNLEEIRNYQYLLGHGVGVLKSPPNPNAAAVFLNWYFSKEGQQAWVDSITAHTPAPVDGAHTVRADIEPHPDAVVQGTVPDYARLSQYSLQGMEAGAAEMQSVLSLWKRIEAGGR